MALKNRDRRDEIEDNNQDNELRYECTVPKLMTAVDLSQVLGFTPSTIVNFAGDKSGNAEKIPPFIRMGKLLRWHPAVVRRWINAKAGLDTWPPIEPQEHTIQTVSSDAPTPLVRKRGRPSLASQLPRKK